MKNGPPSPVVVAAPDSAAVRIGRRSFLGASLAAAACTPGLRTGSARVSGPRFDILVRNGDIFDPERRTRRKADVGVKDGKISAIEASLPADQAREVIDAAGLIVSPGLVDMHTHCYGGDTFGVRPDDIAGNSGVTTWVDAGSFDSEQVKGFRRNIVAPSHARVFGYVYLYPSSRNPDLDAVDYVRKASRVTGAAVKANPDILLGVKVQIGKNMNGKYSPEFMKISREMGDEFQIPIMVHISFAPPSTDEVMGQVRARDVITHCYNAHTLGILNDGGDVLASVREARSRGVLFDVGHGAGSFNFEIARKAIAAGFLPDTISTDLFQSNSISRVFDLPTTLSKLMHAGMTLDQVLLCGTLNAARIVGHVPGLGTMAVGAPADIAVLTVENGSFPLTDAQGDTQTAKQRIFCRATICRGLTMARSVAKPV